MVEKKSKEYFTVHVNDRKFRFHCAEGVFSWALATLISMLLGAASTLSWQSWVLPTWRPYGLQSWQYLLSGSLQGRRADPRVNIENHIQNSLTSVLIPSPWCFLGLPRERWEGRGGLGFQHLASVLSGRPDTSAARHARLPPSSAHWQLFRGLWRWENWGNETRAKASPCEEASPFLSGLRVHVVAATGRKWSDGFHILDPNKSYRECWGLSYISQIGCLHLRWLVHLSALAQLAHCLASSWLSLYKFISPSGLVGFLGFFFNTNFYSLPETFIENWKWLIKEKVYGIEQFYHFGVGLLKQNTLQSGMYTHAFTYTRAF